MPFLFLPLTLVLACTPGVERAQDGRPNILFVFSDDHAAHAIGAYGGYQTAIIGKWHLQTEPTAFDHLAWD